MADAQSKSDNNLQDEAIQKGWDVGFFKPADKRGHICMAGPETGTMRVVFGRRAEGSSQERECWMSEDIVKQFLDSYEYPVELGFYDQKTKRFKGPYSLGEVTWCPSGIPGALQVWPKTRSKL